MALTTAQIQNAYVAFFNRPADVAGLTYWSSYAGSTADLLNTFAQSAEYKSLYSGLNNTQTVNAVYQNLFGHAPDVAGLAYWVTQLDNGKLAIGNIADAINKGAQGTDATIIANKVTAATAFTVALDTTAEIVAYAGVNSIGLTAVKNWLAAVTSDSATLTNATSATTLTSITSTVLNNVASNGTTFTLTTGADAVTGTANSDTINAYIDAAAATDTFTGADNIDGGAGVDTLNITTDGAAAGALPGATIANVEVFKIRETGGTAGVYDFAAVAGETSVINNKSTDQVTFDKLAAGTTVTVLGDGTTTNGATVFTMAAVTDAVTLNIADGVKAGNITRNATGAATVTVNSTGAANTIGTLDLDTATAVKGLTINATTNLTGSLAADYAASSTLTVSGAAEKVDLSGAALSANFTKVDASGLTAGGVLVQVNQADTTVDTQFIGGTGNDTLDVGKVVYNSTTLTAAGGAGTDTIKMSDAAALTTTTAKYISGFETLSIYDDADDATDSFDASMLTGITAIAVAATSGSDAVTVTNLSAAQAAAVTLSDTQTDGVTLTIKDATTVGQLDTLSIAINDGATAVNTITVANVTSAGAETINFALTDNLTLSAATGLTAFTKIAFTGAGALDMTLGNFAQNVNATIDASASTGTVTINAAAATTNGLAIKGSATKANTITGTNQDDVITGGTGVDTVKNQNNAATDADTVDFVSDSSADIFEITTLTGKTTITNFDAATTTTTEDLVNVSHDNVDGGEVQVTAAAAQAALTDDRTYVIEQAVGAAGSLTTGSSTTLATADFTATTLTNVAAFLAERYTTSNDTNTDVVFVLNNGTNTYIYEHTSAAGNTTIDAAELVLIGVVNGAVLNAGDVYQTTV